MEEVTELNALRGSLINLEYTLSNGQTVRVWEGDRIYLGNQLRKEGSERCYGVAADETYLMVSEYGGYGDDVQIVIFKRWKDSKVLKGGRPGRRPLRAHNASYICGDRRP